MVLYEGQTVGPYQVVGQLGQGGMATVYKAYHAKLDRHVAIKVMHKAFSEDPDFLARFEREAQIIAKLEHPHIVPVYDYNEHEGQPYLVMKFIEGQTLKKVLSEGPQTLDQIVAVMSDVAGALTYAHQHGVLHRDVKPSNIVIGTDGNVYLTDFGLARMAQMSASTMSQDMILGTPQYISPEQASGLKNLDSRTDIYSFGVILYEMVVGRVPFNADTPYAIVHDHIYSELPRPSDINPAIPAAVEVVLMKALAKNPADRYASANEMMDEFRKAADQSNLVALDPNRNKTADAAFARYQPKPMDDSPTTIGDTPEAGIPSPIPGIRFIPPGSPRRPEAPRPPVPPGSGKRIVVERRIDLGKNRGELQVDMGDLGKKMEEGIRKVAQWGEKVASNIEEAAKEGARSAAYAANSPEAEEARIRKRIERRFKERQGLLSHFMIFVVMNILFWGLWANGLQDMAITAIKGTPNVDIPAAALQTAKDIPWPLFITLPWGIGIISHIFTYYNKYGPGAQRREEAIEREIDRQRERSAAYAKPKNDERVRLELTDDGEIQEVYDDEPSRAGKRKRR